MKHQYESINLRAKSLALIEQANNIIDEYQEQGYELTVRQIYYQFVARGFISNSFKSYLCIMTALNKGRLSGLIDWSAIVDRTRTVYTNPHWNSPQEILESAASSYKLDTRADQKYYIEVWIEKNALLGVIEPICKKLDITFLPCIGYYSLSSMWRAANRFNEQFKPSVLLHLGDHDPSGIDMTRDIRDRLRIFGVKDIEVRRLALNIDQVEEYDPPPNFAKSTDSRYGDYAAKYGDQSWELDALPPDVITKLIKKAVDKLTNTKKRQALIDLQEKQGEELYEIAKSYND